MPRKAFRLSGKGPGSQAMMAANNDTPRAAILLSRQPMRPSAETAWVRRSVEAVRALTAENFTIYSSIGMLTWDLLTGLASINHTRMRLYIPDQGPSLAPEQTDNLCDRFELDQSLVEFVAVPQQATKEETLRRRDRALIDDADLLCPVSLRPGGNMEKYLEKSGRPVRKEFVTAYSGRSGGPGYSLSDDSISREINSAGNDYIIHWTRATNGCWPGEREIDLVRAILKSDTWPRSAYHTLRKILNTRKLQASGRHMPGGAETVSFSGLSPRRMIPLMRWRARYRQMSFEPYGVGLNSNDAAALGIRKVEYGASGDTKNDSDTPVWLRQSVGRFADWRTEDEYRSLGDFDLSSIPKDRLVLFCRTVDEAASLEAEFGIRTIPFQR